MIGPIAYLSSPPNVPIVLSFAQTFSTSIDADGDYQYIITSHVTGDPNTISSYTVTKSASSLTILPTNDTQDFEVTIFPYNTGASTVDRVPLSKRWTNLQTFVQASQDADDSGLSRLWEWKALTNRSILAVMGQFYGLVAKDYNTRTSVTISGLDTDTQTTIDVSSLPVMRMGAQTRIVLETNNGGYAEPVTEEEYMTFKSGNSRNRSMMVVLQRSDEFLLKKGDDLSTWGASYLWYPSIPYAATEANKNDFIDIPDGSLIDLHIYKLSMYIRQRNGKPVVDAQPNIERMVKSLMVQLGANISAEEMKRKVQALL